MSPSDLASVGSFASGVAVLISLLYLSAQVRQATRHQQALMLESRATRLTDTNTWWVEPDMAPLWNKLVRGHCDLTEVETAQLGGVIRAIFMTGEATYLQH